MFTKTLEHEQFITRSINDLMELAMAEKDHASQIFRQWYVTEQVEEESNDNEIIAQLLIIRDARRADGGDPKRRVLHPRQRATGEIAWPPGGAGSRLRERFSPHAMHRL